MSAAQHISLGLLSCLGAIGLFLIVCLALSPFAFCYCLWIWRYFSDSQLLGAWAGLLLVPGWCYSYRVFYQILKEAERMR